MKTTQYPLRTILPLLAGLLVAPIVSAAPVLWSGAGGDDNWSTPGNWSGGTPAGNDVFFGELDATGSSGPFGTANNIVNSSLDISRLSYTNQITVGYHTTEISSGVTLTLTNSGNTILVNQPGINVADAQVLPVCLHSIRHDAARLDVATFPHSMHLPPLEPSIAWAWSPA